MILDEWQLLTHDEALETGAWEISPYVAEKNEAMRIASEIMAYYRPRLELLYILRLRMLMIQPYPDLFYP